MAAVQRWASLTPEDRRVLLEEVNADPRLVRTEGAAKALQIFRREVDISMAQIGATKIADLGPQFLMWKDEEDLRRNRR